MKFPIAHKTLGLAFTLLLYALTIPSQASGIWHESRQNHMGTEISVELWAPNKQSAETITKRAYAEVRRLDQMMNPWNPDSDLSRLNRAGAEGPVAVPREIIDVVARAQHYSALSEGAFDITFATVGRHYDYREGKAPTTEKIERERIKLGYQHIQVDEQAGTIAFDQPALQIDLGGIAKGYAVDRVINMLAEAGVKSAVVSAGGDSRVLGDLGGRSRIIGIRHPRKKDEFAALIPLSDTAISTSGDYERFFERDGVRYHHILDPGTGKSASGVQSASVMTSLAIDSDALSTTVFVLGVKKGLALVNSLPGVDAIIIDAQGQLHYSDELLLSTEP